MTDAESVIEEIRESRKRMSERCDHEPAKLIAYLRAFNEKYATQIQEYERAHPSSSSASAAR